ncbi:MAG: ABC transporter permease subunit/CPBP intramembrane protease [Gemmatimonadota bacterium]|nr:hypothetical protein [Gemmatimonadota bacterium]MDP6529169.1 ABC transporter permease subunit/CPBP intramembrane protease [Gemmatimonadota bacterium]MDP6802858.1 ABC transporter permease subunit/CPBP intramembrane protease [Gemmatimonadota bacterium]MDP7032196.1 ABC transporter permease subunit/CPBP intramembrane protease [Gemmatimonadota bacterium]
MIGLIVRKEFAEIRRDRKTILISLLLPVFMYPLLFSFMTRLERKEDAKEDRFVYEVALAEGAASLLGEAVNADSGFARAASPGGDGDALDDALRAGDIMAWAGIEDAAEESPLVSIRYDMANDRSRDASERLADLARDAASEERDRRWREAGREGLPEDLLAIEETDVATEEETGGAAAAKLIPFLLIMTLFAGGAAVATDIVAGEKERGTLETLYLGPVPRRAIASGKYLVVVLVTVMAGLLNLLSMAACFRFGLVGEAAEGLAISGAGVASAAVLVVPLSMLIGGVLLAISAHARSLKEAQYLMTPAMLVAFIPGMLASSQDIALNGFTAFIPVANVALAVRDGLIAPVPVGLLLAVAAASTLWGLLAVRITGRMLSREETILGFDPEPFLSATLAGRTRALHLAMAVTVLAYFYLGSLLQQANVLVGLALSLWIVLPLLGAATLRMGWSGGRVREVLSLRPAPLRAIAAGALLGAGCVFPVAAGLVRVQEIFLPSPTAFFQAMEEVMRSASPVTIVLLMAISPAICEELVFRGVVLGLLRRIMPDRRAILVSAFYFAVFHLSVFRFLPTFLLGLAMGALAVRTHSVLPSMAFHAFYNAGAIGGSLFLGEEWTALGGGMAWLASAGLLAAGGRLLGAAGQDTGGDGGVGAPAGE